MDTDEELKDPTLKEYHTVEELERYVEQELSKLNRDLESKEKELKTCDFELKKLQLSSSSDLNRCSDLLSNANKNKEQCYTKLAEERKDRAEESKNATFHYESLLDQNNKLNDMVTEMLNEKNEGVRKRMDVVETDLDKPYYVQEIATLKTSLQEQKKECEKTAETLKEEKLKYQKIADNVKEERSINNDKIAILNEEVNVRTYCKKLFNINLLMLAVPLLIFSFLLNSTINSTPKLFISEVELHSKLRIFNTVLFIIAILMILIFGLFIQCRKVGITFLIILELFYVGLIIYLSFMIVEIGKLNDQIYVPYQYALVGLILSVFITAVLQINTYYNRDTFSRIQYSVPLRN